MQKNRKQNVLDFKRLILGHLIRWIKSGVNSGVTSSVNSGVNSSVNPKLNTESC